jgi:hypothetical protein
MRNLVMIVAEQPLRTVLTDLYGAFGTVRAPATPLEAVHAIVAEGTRIGRAVISTSVSWAAAFVELLADDFPEIQRSLLTRDGAHTISGETWHPDARMTA